MDDTIYGMKAVLDTNVIYAALRSNRGASFAVLQALRAGRFQMALSVALCLEYEDVLLRDPPPIPADAVQDILDYLVSISLKPALSFNWRPQLRDPKDELVLELAVNGQCPCIVTFNTRDLAGCERFGVQAITPAQFLALLGGTP